jgi:hypothetical protein
MAASWAEKLTILDSPSTGVDCKMLSKLTTNQVRPLTTPKSARRDLLTFRHCWSPRARCRPGPLRNSRMAAEVHRHSNHSHRAADSSIRRASPNRGNPQPPHPTRGNQNPPPKRFWAIDILQIREFNASGKSRPHPKSPFRHQPAGGERAASPIALTRRYTVAIQFFEERHDDAARCAERLTLTVAVRGEKIHRLAFR